MKISMNFHLEHDPVRVRAQEIPEHKIVYLQFSDPDTYGDLNIFFPYESIAKVHEIARLIEEAQAQARPERREASEDESHEEEVVF